MSAGGFLGKKGRNAVKISEGGSAGFLLLNAD